MKQKVIEYGATHPVVVEKSNQSVIICVSEDTNEGYILMGHGIDKLPKPGDKGKIVFERGGPMKGHWKYYAE